MERPRQALNWRHRGRDAVEFAASWALNSRPFRPIKARCFGRGDAPGMETVAQAAIAQLVEHVIRNDGVTGSSPVCGTISFKGLAPSRLFPKSSSKHIVSTLPDWAVRLIVRFDRVRASAMTASVSDADVRRR